MGKAGTITFSYPEGLGVGGGGGGWRDTQGKFELRGRTIGKKGKREGVGERGLFPFKAIHSKKTPYSRLSERASLPKLLPEVNCVVTVHVCCLGPSVVANWTMGLFWRHELCPSFQEFSKWPNSLISN